MKTFKDLEFKPHGNRGVDFLDEFVDITLIQDETKISGEAVQARLDFDNGYGVSVLTGSSFFHIDEDGPYEMALFKNGHIHYIRDTDDKTFEDVVDYCDEEEITHLMKVIQEMPKDTKVAA